MNREAIENHQEHIIEIEENTPAFDMPPDKFIKEERGRNTHVHMKEEIIDQKQKSASCVKIELQLMRSVSDPAVHQKHIGWFSKGTRPIGLKGGSDKHQSVAPALSKDSQGPQSLPESNLVSSHT